MRFRVPNARLAASLALFACAAIALGACGSSGSDSGTASPGGTSSGGGSAGDGPKIGLGITGPKNDKGFYQAAYEGAEEATQAEGGSLSVIDNLEQPQQRFEALKNLSIENELVIGGGAEFVDAVEALAPQYPDVEYVVLTGALSGDEPNTAAYVPRQGVPAYIGGAVAAKVSGSGAIGFVGGLEIPPTEASDKAFEAGAKEQDPAIKYATTTVGSFSDPAGAKSAATAQIDSGAGAIFAFLDAGTPGVLQAAEESGKEVGVIGAISPRCDESDLMVGTAVLNTGALTADVIKHFSEEALPEGETVFFGIEDPELQRFELCPKYDTKELSALVDKLTKEINAEKIEFPEGV